MAISTPRSLSAKTTPKHNPRTQAERRQEAEKKLLFAARKLVAQKGWVGMTLSEVGEAAGYSRGLAAHHFGNKSGLLRALANYINDRFHEDVRKPPETQPGIDTLRGFVRTYFGRTDPSWTNTRALLLLMCEATIDGSETGDILSNYNTVVLSFLEEHFQAGIDSGELRDDLSPSVCAALLMGTLRGVMLQKLVKNSKLELKPLSDQYLEMLDRSFLRAPASVSTPKRKSMAPKKNLTTPKSKKHALTGKRRGSTA